MHPLEIETPFGCVIRVVEHLSNPTDGALLTFAMKAPDRRRMEVWLSSENVAALIDWLQAACDPFPKPEPPRPGDAAALANLRKVLADIDAVGVAAKWGLIGELLDAARVVAGQAQSGVPGVPQGFFDREYEAMRRDMAAYTGQAADDDQRERVWHAANILADFRAGEATAREAVDALLAATAGQQPSAPRNEWWDRLADVPGHVSAVHDSMGRLWQRDGYDWFTSAAYSQRLSTAVTDLSGWGPFFAEKADQS